MTTETTSVVATIRLATGERGTIRIHCEEAGWIITCNGHHACIAPQTTREAAVEAIRQAWGDPLWDLQETDAEIETRARAFAGRPIEDVRCRVEADGTVLVWDSVAGHFTRCHSLSESAIRRIRRLAKAED